MKKYLIKSEKSFTLIELLLVISIIGLIASILLVSLKKSRDTARITNIYRAQSTIHNGLGAFILAEWRFDEGSGTTVKDLSGNNNNGSFHNSVGWTDDTPLHKGYGLLFDALNECVEIDLNNGNLGAHRYNDFTITAWYKSSANITDDDQYIFHHYCGISADTIIFGIADDTGHLDQVRFHYRTSSGAFQLVYGTSDVVDQKWHLLIASRGNGRVKIFVDAELETDVAITNNDFIQPGTHMLSIGCEPDDLSDNDQLFGVLDEVLVYGEDLSLSQIKKFTQKDC